MPREIHLESSVPVRGAYDVVVAGGGLAGTAAALAAKRAGKKTLLLEKSNLLGGLGTIGLINLFVPMCNGRGRQIISGMAEEFLRLSIKNGFDTLPLAWRDGEPKKPTEERYVTRYSAQIFALELLNLLVEEGVDILLDCIASQPVMNDGKCTGLVTESKSGREFVEAGVVVDATGDADILYRAGVPTVQGKNFFTYIAFAATLDSCRKAADSGMIRDMYAQRYFAGPADLYGRI